MDEKENHAGQGHGQDALVEGPDDGSQGAVIGGDGRGAADVIPGRDGLKVDEVQLTGSGPARRSCGRSYRGTGFSDKMINERGPARQYLYISESGAETSAVRAKNCSRVQSPSIMAPSAAPADPAIEAAIALPTSQVEAAATLTIMAPRTEDPAPAVAPTATATPAGVEKGRGAGWG